MSGRISALRLVALAALMFASLPAPALAIPPTVHDISTCADLQTLGQDDSTRGDTINLTADLDCSGISNFAPLYSNGFPGNGLSGVLDGHGHSISHLTINHPSNPCIGLLSRISGGTVRNLHLASGTVSGYHGTGALAGCIEQGTVTNVTSAVTISNKAMYTGGLIGWVASEGDTLVEDSSATGNVTNIDNVTYNSRYTGGLIGSAGVQNGNLMLRRVFATGTVTGNDGNMGGLVGYVSVDADTTSSTLTIEDSYSTGDVDSSGYYNVGGLIGYAFGNGHGAAAAINLSRVYATGAVGGTYTVGGLVGLGLAYDTTVTIADSFASGAVTGDPGETGGILGSSQMTLPDVITMARTYYDGPSTGQAVCSEGTAIAGTCTRVDTTATPDYFKGNRTNAPFNVWNTSGVWTANPGGYPTLIPLDDGDGIDKAEEAAAPNGGDANSDGISDAAQPSVASFENPVSGQYAVLETGCGSLFNTGVGAESTTAGATDVAYNYPGGLIKFVAIGCTSGATATITQTFYGLDTGAQYTLRKSKGSTYTTVPGAVFSAATIGGQSALQVVYQVQDGSALDDDGLTDGNIVDPAGPAVAMLGVPNTGLGSLGR